MKNLLFCLFFLLASCSGELKTLPSSTGSFSEIIFVVEDALWENKIKPLVTKVSKEFADVYKGDYAHFTLKEISEQPKSIIHAGNNKRSWRALFISPGCC